MTSPLPVIPKITVEAGFVPQAPVGAAGVLILGSATQGMLGTDTLGNSDNWTDITQWVLNFTVTRASTRVQGPLLQYQASTASVLLDNSDSRFDPDNLAGPYISAGITQVRPMIPLRVTAVFAGTTYRLFTGFADAWTESPVTYEGGYSEVTVTATDGFKMLTTVMLPAAGSPVGTGDSTDGRVNRVLTAAGWYTDRRNLGAGFTTALQGSLYGASALSLMQLAADTEAGQLYVDGNGVVQFRNRRALMQDTRSASPQATFSDLPGTFHTYVTAASSGAHALQGIALTVKVLTGAAAVQNGATVAGTSLPPDRAITPNATGSLVYGAVATEQTSTAFTAAAGTTLSQNVPDVPHGAVYGTLVSSATTTSGTPVTLGASAPAVNGQIALAEILASGTLAEDASSPAPVNLLTGQTVTTATFAPPVGSLLVAMLACDSDGLGVMSSTVTSPNLTWTRVVTDPSITTGNSVSVWIAPVPATVPVALAYAAVSRANDDTQLVNDVQNTRAGGSNVQEAQDANSIGTYLFARSYARTDLPQTTDADALAWAQFIITIARASADRFDSLQVDPLADTAGLYPQLLGREIGDRIQVWKTPPTGNQFSKDAFIAGITHTFDVAQLTWLTTWTLQDAAPWSVFLTLNDPIRGQLGTGLLAY